MGLTPFCKQLIYCLPLFTFLSCTSPSDVKLNEVNFLDEPPVITGIYVTTGEYPDGTGEVIGNPSYTVKDINAFPNPYNKFIPAGPRHYPIVHQPYIVFNHIPKTRVTITIVRGQSVQEASNSRGSLFGIPASKTACQKVRTIEKDLPMNFITWDVKDDNSESVPPGYYRAYISGEDVSPNYYLDLYVESQGYLDRY